MSIMGYNAGHRWRAVGQYQSAGAPGPGIYHLFRASHAALPRTHHEEEQSTNAEQEEPSEHPAMR